MRLLLVEDNDRLSEFLEKALRDANFTVDRVADLGGADAALAGARFDSVILDLGLPDGNGMDLIDRRRSAGDQTPILVLTARDGLSDRADDYMIKPFAMEELVARIKALLRRPGAALGVHLNLGNVSLDTAGPSLLVDGKRAAVTRRELALLEILLRRPGNVVNRNMIEDGIYGFDDEVGTNALEVLVSRLRKKLISSGADIQLHTVRGVGYMVMEPS